MLFIYFVYLWGRHLFGSILMFFLPAKHTEDVLLAQACDVKSRLDKESSLPNLNYAEVTNKTYFLWELESQAKEAVERAENERLSEEYIQSVSTQRQ